MITKLTFFCELRATKQIQFYPKKNLGRWLEKNRILYKEGNDYVQLMRCAGVHGRKVADHSFHALFTVVIKKHKSHM